MNISDLYPILRALLGDRQEMGSFYYAEDDLLSGVRTCFALGLAPAAYALGPGGYLTGTTITPDLATGDDLALVAYETVLLTVRGEDGERAVRTRELTVHDGGDRKKDLMTDMKLLIHQIRNGRAVFSTRQSFTQFLEAGGINWKDFTGFTLNSLPGDLVI